MKSKYCVGFLEFVAAIIDSIIGAVNMSIIEPCSIIASIIAPDSFAIIQLLQLLHQLLRQLLFPLISIIAPFIAIIDQLLHQLLHQLSIIASIIASNIASIIASNYCVQYFNYCKYFNYCINHCTR